jgi:hypothetical protein
MAQTNASPFVVTARAVDTDQMIVTQRPESHMADERDCRGTPDHFRCTDRTVLFLLC